MLWYTNIKTIQTSVCFNGYKWKQKLWFNTSSRKVTYAKME